MILLPCASFQGFYLASKLFLLVDVLACQDLYLVEVLGSCVVQFDVKPLDLLIVVFLKQILKPHEKTTNDYKWYC